MSSFEGVKGIVPRLSFVVQESTEPEHGGEGRGRGEFSLEDSLAFMHPNASVLQFSHQPDKATNSNCLTRLLQDSARQSPFSAACGHHRPAQTLRKI